VEIFDFNSIPAQNHMPAGLSCQPHIHFTGDWLAYVAAINAEAAHWMRDHRYREPSPDKSCRLNRSMQHHLV
jgi:hypothetical protein